MEPTPAAWQAIACAAPVGQAAVAAVGCLICTRIYDHLHIIVQVHLQVERS